MRNKQETAFTLIELLVVIATIALLTSIVLVALKGGREKANIAKVLQWARSVEAQLGGDIVGSWNFNEGTSTTAYDATGYNNGTLMNGVSWTDGVRGLTGKALYFDGVDDYVDVSGVGSYITSGSFTVSAFVNLSSLASIRTIFHLSDAPSTNDIQLRFYTGVFQFLKYNGAGWDWVQSITFPSTNTWYHVAGVYNESSGMQIYINSVMEKSNGLVGRGAVAATTAYIGATPVPLSRFFIGTIDEVRIYSRALTAMEIQKHYAEGTERHKLLVEK